MQPNDTDYDLMKISEDLAPYQFDTCSPTPTPRMIFQSHIHMDEVRFDNPPNASICLPCVDKVRSAAYNRSTWLPVPQPMTRIDQIIDDRVRCRFEKLHLVVNNTPYRRPLQHNGDNKTWSTVFQHGNVTFIGETIDAELNSKKLRDTLERARGYVIIPKVDPQKHGLTAAAVADLIQFCTGRNLTPVGITNVMCTSPDWKKITTMTEAGIGLNRPRDTIGVGRLPIAIPLLPKQGPSFRDEFPNMGRH